jgi:hypothetical protein
LVFCLKPLAPFGACKPFMQKNSKKNSNGIDTTWDLGKCQLPINFNCRKF